MNQLILASSSPRRRELLQQAGYLFEVVPPSPSAEDDAPRHADPSTLVANLACRKGADVVQQLARKPAYAGCWVLAADTVAECRGEVLGKPDDEADARRILLALSGREHRVLTGVCLWNCSSPEQPSTTHVAETTLLMESLSDEWLTAYLASGAWVGKAGAFGYQDDLGVVKIIEGSESNVVGLPMEQVQQILQDVGIESRP